MVMPGEVDNELEGETKEECKKYGEVNKVVIAEVNLVHLVLIAY
jgi:splicing factor 45